MSILNTIKASPESKDYHLKDEKEGESNDALVLDDSSNLTSKQIIALFGVSRKVATLITQNLPYRNSQDFYNKVLEKIIEHGDSYEKDKDFWIKKCSIIIIKKLYSNSRFKLFYM